MLSEEAIKRVKRTLFALLTMLAILLAGCGAGAPKAVVSESRFDFGDVRMSNDKKDLKTHEFVIKNEGQGDLKLEELQVKLLKGC